MTPPLAQRIPLAAANNAPLAHLFGYAARLPAQLGPQAAALDPAMWQRALFAPAEDFLAEPGKGFRARLVELGWQLAGGTGMCPQELAVALEWLHAGSLIVDDIEDGALARRGQPALHHRHGLGPALNTGNWLYFAALHHLDEADLPQRVRADLQRRAIAALVKCHAGQAIDLTARVDLLPQSEVAHVVAANTALKTGALMALAAELGAAATGADEDHVAAIAQFGESLGNGLQMLDDAGSVLSDQRKDKGLEDLYGSRPTWPWAWIAADLDPFTWARLMQRLQLMVATGHGADDLLGEVRQRIAHLGRTQPAYMLHAAFTQLRTAIGNHPALTHIENEIERLKVSYV